VTVALAAFEARGFSVGGAHFRNDHPDSANGPVFGSNVYTVFIFCAEVAIDPSGESPG
jgi:hypothetical protein